MVSNILFGIVGALLGYIVREKDLVVFGKIINKAMDDKLGKRTSNKIQDAMAELIIQFAESLKEKDVNGNKNFVDNKTIDEEMNKFLKTIEKFPEKLKGVD